MTWAVIGQRQGLVVKGMSWDDVGQRDHDLSVLYHPTTSTFTGPLTASPMISVSVPDIMGHPFESL